MIEEKEHTYANVMLMSNTVRQNFQREKLLWLQYKRHSQGNIHRCNSIFINLWSTHMHGPYHTGLVIAYSTGSIKHSQ